MNMVYQNKFVASVKVGGRILRERDRENVFLPFGSEYSILLKNLEGRKASISVEIDGEDVLDRHTLIMHPNQTTELERFILNGNLNAGPRFKFIEKTSQISDHRGDKVDDGISRISYQFEKEVFASRNSIISYDVPKSSFHHRSRDIFRGDTERGMPTTYNSSSVVGQSIGNEVVTDSLDDEGITVKGSDSSQKFYYGNIGILENQVHTICIKLHGTHDKGVVHAPVTIQAKSKCETCGTTNTSRNKFCGQCGTSLTW